MTCLTRCFLLWHSFYSNCFHQVLREFCVKPEDVLYFMHDSASYMAPAATRMRTDKGYNNLVSSPCWAHILSKVGDVIMDGNCLPELAEYLRLSHLIFARLHYVMRHASCYPSNLACRSPWWRTKWVQHQQAAAEEFKAAKLESEKTKKPCPLSQPPPVKSMLRGNDTRWSSQFDEVC